MDPEKALSEFLDSETYDNAETALFIIVRKAFLAGYQAAGGKLPEKPPAPKPKQPFWK